jgi:uncharacterized membrane protein
MMNIPIHPQIVHFPLALTFILPILILIFALMIKTHKMAPQTWLIIIGLQLATTVSGYISMETGENEEDQVEKIVTKKFIQEHEERAEVFVGVTVLALVVSVASFFLIKEVQFYAHVLVVVISVISGFFAYRTGKSGGELVYHHGAASVYLNNADAVKRDLQPVSEAGPTVPAPLGEENDGLKVDENDYGDSSEDEVDEDFDKTED